METSENKPCECVPGKAALITGAASGIGRATAILLASHGAKVMVSDLDEAGATQTTAAIAASGGTAFAHRLDVTVESDWENMIERIGQTIHFPRAVALECAQRGENIRINTVVPAGVKTAMWNKMPFWDDISASETWNAPADTVGSSDSPSRKRSHGQFSTSLRTNPRMSRGLRW